MLQIGDKMFEFTIRESGLLNRFKQQLSRFVNKSYKFTMLYLSTPELYEAGENERLILIAVNKSVYQNLYSFLHLNENHMQYAAFACLENAVNAMRLYSVLYANREYMHSFITNPDFSLEVCEYEIAERQQKEAYNENEESFSLKEFSAGLHKVNAFELKGASISSQIHNGEVYLGLSCGTDISEDFQEEVRKNLIGAYLSLNKHTQYFFNGGLDEELEELEGEIYATFLEYVKKFG